MFKRPRKLRGPAVFVLTLLAIEFLDEFVFGAREAAWPMIRADLGLSYVEIGILLTIPSLFANVIEPILGILADTPKRRVIVLGGGVAFTAACLLTGVSASFAILLLSFMLFYPASGAFVSLSQSTLMDIDSARHEYNMARWTFAGSAGVVAGSLILGGAVAVGFDWRSLFIIGALLAAVLVVILARFRFPRQQAEADGAPVSFGRSMRATFSALKRPDVLRWLILLECSNLMLDVLYGYLALYFVDVVQIDEGQAALAVSVWTVVGLLGDLLLIPLLERVRGLSYLRISAIIELILFPAFLLVPGLFPKLVIIGALGFFNAGWYAILQGNLYSAMPNQSGAVLAISNLSGSIGGLIPLGIGLLAERFGLGAAMWALMLGPIALLIGLPRHRAADAEPPIVL